MSDSELRNLRGGSSRRENERPTPTRKSNFRKAQIDFLPSPLGEGRKKAAFTLAEVLITLGIIGVVAALTLPTLISNYQKRVYVTQLKKSVSVLSQGFTTMMGHDGVTELKDTEAFSGMGTDECTNAVFNSADCLSLREGLESVFSGIQFLRIPSVIFVKDIQGNRYLARSGVNIELADGSMWIFFTFYKTTQHSALGRRGYIGYIYVDVNGEKNPNLIGRDIFKLNIASNGDIIPSGSQAWSEIKYGDPNTGYWRTGTSKDRNCATTGYSGMACAGRVLEEDAMNY